MTTPRSFRSLAALPTVAVLAALFVLGSAGCGDSAEDTGSTRPPPTSSSIGELPPGSYEMTVAEGDVPVALAFLEGEWTMEIEADGDALVMHESGQTVIGRISVTGNELTFRDLGGELACLSPIQSGRYTWTETPTALDLALVSDGCDGRRFVLLHTAWSKS